MKETGPRAMVDSDRNEWYMAMSLSLGQHFFSQNYIHPIELNGIYVILTEKTCTRSRDMAIIYGPDSYRLLCPQLHQDAKGCWYSLYRDGKL